MGFDPSREGQLSEEQLKWGYWWVTHKVQVRKVFSVVLGIIALALLGYGIFGFADWYFGSGVRERQEIAQLTKPVTNFLAFHEKFRPEEIIIEGTIILEAGAGAYDLATRLTNPNLTWWAEFDHQYVAGEPVSPLRHGYVLPGEVKYLHELGTKMADYPSGADISITNLVWHRVDNHVVRPDYATWSAARLNFLTSDIKFQAPDPTDQLKVSRASFKVANHTGYGYWKAGFFVVLLGGGAPVGVNYVTISQLRAGDVRPVEVSWFSDLGRVDSVEVTPDVNILDDKVYIPPGQ